MADVHRVCKILLVAGVALVVLSHLRQQPLLGLLGALLILFVLFLDCEREKSCRR